MRPHVSTLGPDGAPCTECGAPLVRDQRFCLECGARRGPPRFPPTAAGDGDPPPGTARAPMAGLPSPRALGVAALLLLGFGVAVGTAAGPRATDTLAAAGSRRIVIVAPAPAPGPAPARAPAPERATPAPTSAPAPSATPQPQPAATTPAPPAAAAPVSAPSAPDPAPATAAPQATTPPSAPAGPEVHHAWVVTLTGHTFAEALAEPTVMPYLARTLRPQGALLDRYRAVGRSALANGVVMLADVAPTLDHERSCPVFTDVDPAARTGCVFATSVPSLPGELTAAGKTWRGYVEGADAGPDPAATCRHPAIGEADRALLPRPGDPYLTARDPLVYFHAVIHGLGCPGTVAGLSRLVPDAQDATSAPALSWVVPDACHDGDELPCAPGAPAGLAPADAWLRAQLAPVLASKAYADHGLVVITFDAPGPAGGPVGALVLCADVAAGSTDHAHYDHGSLRRTLARAFGLGALDRGSARAFGDDVFRRAVTGRSR